MPFLNFGLQCYTVGCHGNIIVNQFRWCLSLSCSSLLVVSIKCVCFIMMEGSCLKYLTEVGQFQCIYCTILAQILLSVAMVTRMLRTQNEHIFSSFCIITFQ